MTNQIKIWLDKNLNQFTRTPMNVKNVVELTEITDDPGNELLFMALLVPQDENANLYEIDTPINVKRLDDLFCSTSFAYRDHAIEINEAILMNNTILLPITFLK